jgi:hypothetical protein
METDGRDRFMNGQFYNQYPNLMVRFSGRTFTSNRWARRGALKVCADSLRKTKHRLTILKGLRYEY